MKSIKSILFIIASLFLLFLTYTQSYQIGTWPQLSFLQSLKIAALANLYITGIFAFAGFALPTYKLLPDSYYIIKNSKQLKALYDRLGVKHFRIFLLLTFWAKPFQRKNYFTGTKTGLGHLDRETRQDEFGHLLAFICLVLAAVYFLWISQFWLSLFCTLINIPFNLYPIILQRYHRVRIQKLLAKT